MSSDDFPNDFTSAQASTSFGGHHDLSKNASTNRGLNVNDEEDEGQDLQDEDDEDDDDEDDEEDDEDEEDGRQPGGRPRKRQKRDAVNRFLDVEAEVDNDDDEYDEDDEDFTGARDFIADDTVDTDDTRKNIMTGHLELDRRHEAIMNEDAEQVARSYREKAAGYRGPARYMGDADQMPQRMLMPSVKDPFLWQVRVKTGREKEIVFSIMRKFLENEYSPNPLSIFSAFYRDSLPGIIYVEARNERHVNQAISGLVGVYPSKGFTLVPIEEMASLLKIKKIEVNIAPGAWVRVKRGKYAGDLAQVLDVTDNGEEAGVKMIPRIDLTPKEKDPNLKRKKGATSATIGRPPQRLFNPDEVVKVYGMNSIMRKAGVYVFQGESYQNGFLEKDLKINGLILENVNPTLDEITAFHGGDDTTEGASAVDLSVIANAAKKAATAVLQPGDHVEVFEGEQTGLEGTVESIHDDVVVLRPRIAELEDSKIEVPAASLRKRFKSGDHVKVMAGKNADETGLVVAVNGEILTIWSDVSNQEVTVFAKDVREAAEVGSGINAVGQYELHDLVQLDQQTVGVIFKTERVSLRVIDQNGIVRQVQPHQITMRRDSSRAVATDAEGQPIRIHDTLKEVAGERRRGNVLHIHQSQVAFLHNREISENNGVFVVRCRNLTSLTPKGNSATQKANADLAAAAIAALAMGGRGPKDKLINMQVTIVKGDWKGYMGTIKDTNGNNARVELATTRKVINITKDKLRRKNRDGTFEEIEKQMAQGNMGPPSAFPQRVQNGYNPNASSGVARTPNPYLAGGGMTPGGAVGRTPNPYSSGAGGRTPGWGAQPTPNPYANASRTPAWGAQPTPNPHQGGRTPGYGGDWGGATPAHNTFGGTSPAYNSATSPANTAWAQTPGAGAYSAPTPGPALSAPTPGGMGLSTATPFSSAPTPGASGWGATPGAISAPTPGGVYSAPTPGGDMWGGGVDDSGDSNSRWLEECVGFSVHAKFESRGRYEAGKLDDLDCVIQTIDIATAGGMESTATANFEEGQSVRTTLDRFVPIDPVAGDYAYAFAGPSKGNVIKIEGLDGRFYHGRDVMKSDQLAMVAKGDVVKVTWG